MQEPVWLLVIWVVSSLASLVAAASHDWLRRVLGKAGIGERPAAQVEHRAPRGHDPLGMFAAAAQAGVSIRLDRLGHMGDGTPTACCTKNRAPVAQLDGARLEYAGGETLTHLEGTHTAWRKPSSA